MYLKSWQTELDAILVNTMRTVSPLSPTHSGQKKVAISILMKCVKIITTPSFALFIANPSATTFRKFRAHVADQTWKRAIKSRTPQGCYRRLYSP